MAASTTPFSCPSRQGRKFRVAVAVLGIGKSPEAARGGYGETPRVRSFGAPRSALAAILSSGVSSVWGAPVLQITARARKTSQHLAQR